MPNIPVQLFPLTTNHEQISELIFLFNWETFIIVPHGFSFYLNGLGGH